MGRSLGLAICFHRFLFPFSSKFPDLNFGRCVLDARNPSLRSKRFQSSYCAKVRADAKKRFPSPSPVILFFCSRSNFLDEPREETLATQAEEETRT